MSGRRDEAPRIDLEGSSVFFVPIVANGRVAGQLVALMPHIHIMSSDIGRWKIDHDEPELDPSAR
jgi:hypothetical protein